MDKLYGQYMHMNISKKEMKKFLELILEVVRFEAVTELTFDYLKVLAPREEEKYLLDKMLEDEREHFRQLKLMYFHITGRQAEVDFPVFKRPETYLSGIEEIFYEKIEIINTYKKMKKMAPIFQMRDEVTTFIFDELSHLSMLNHILIQHHMKERSYSYTQTHFNNPQYPQHFM